MAKNKIRPGDKRKQDAQAAAAKHRVQNEAREKEIAEEAAKKEAAAAVKKSSITFSDEKGTVKTKSSAKAAGLKSAFVIGDDVLLTSFGKGNDVILEKRFSKENNATDFDNKLNITPISSRVADDKKTKYEFNIRNKATTDDPRINGSASPARQDMLGQKAKLEKKYFGVEFNDNIHIQLIHNILDIEKILAIHINNIVTSLNNIMDVDEPKTGDIIGYSSLLKTWNEFENKTETKLFTDFENFYNNSKLSYFGSGFYDTGFDTKAQLNSKKRSKEEVYYILCLLGQLRQEITHGNSNYIYNLANDTSEAATEVKSILNSFYGAQVENLNQEFINHSNKNLVILNEILKPQNKQKLLQDYYDFVVSKKYKNLGFSIKKLRETIVNNDDFDTEIKDERFDTVRQKLYQLFDFIIYDYYNNNPDEISCIVENLRNSLNNEEKEVIYYTTAKKLWKNISLKITSGLLPQMNGNSIKNITADEEFADIFERDDFNKISSDETSCFAKIIYLLTLFIDGKEINDLLTTLINKFENIASFIYVLESQPDLNISLKPEYSLFEESKALSADLRVINSFARMSKPLPAAKMDMFIDAAIILGSDNTRDELVEYFNGIFEKATEGKNKGKLKDSTIRNFITNNVISSTRFNYIVRYCNPVKVRELIKNKSILEFAINRIPDEQIARYYEACYSGAIAGPKVQREKLLEKLHNLSFEEIKDVKEHKTKGNSLEIEKKKAVVRLYLTILYLITKNLVNVNSRYFIAFHSLERDFVNQYEDKEKFDPKTKENWLALTNELVLDNDSYKNQRFKGFLKENAEKSDPVVITHYRNSVAHLNAIRNINTLIADENNEQVNIHFRSYYELYHYLMQRGIINRVNAAKQSEKINEHTKTYFENLKINNSYSKDFVKALNMPFAYNLARYKNLSIDGLFDKNDERTDREKGIKL